MKKKAIGLVILVFLCTLGTKAQIRRPERNTAARDTAAAISLDSLRKREESRKDSVVPTAKYIRYTNLAMLRDSVYTLQIDTSLSNFQHYNPLNQPNNPSIHLGTTGLAYRDLLFQPAKTIGFQSGFHALDRYVLRSDSVRYYIARSPYTELYYVSGKVQEQIFRVTHTQNVTPNWNVGLNYNRIGGDGFYKNQHPDHLNAALFTWYRANNQRYQLMAHAVFNNLKAGENGSTVRQDVFDGDQLFSKDAEFVRLSATGTDRPRQTWRENTLFLKQTYDFGRRDSLKTADQAAILPTQRLAYTISYTKQQFRFFRNEPDTYLVFPHLQPETTNLTNDSTEIAHLSNAFNYSFYLRGRSVGFLRNELKLDVGAQHDTYRYLQAGNRQQFQNLTLLATLAYRFNEKVNVLAQVQQIAQGSQAGDYLYEAQTHLRLSKSAGRIILGVYIQNKSPEELVERINYQFHQWSTDFKRSQIQNLSFRYENPALRFFAKAEYYRVQNYLYFRETNVSKAIEPLQSGPTVNLVKLSMGNHIQLGKLHWESLVVYQKSADLGLLRVPELYTYHSMYYDVNLFKVLRTQFGVDVRYHTAFQNPAYAINVGQFYNQQSPTTFSSYPVADVFVRATLKRTNLFVKYDYANQGMFSKGYYTVDRYPMPDRILKFGLSWKFYN